MFPLLAVQAAIIPFILSFVLFFATRKVTFIQLNRTSFMILMWLVLYVWITNLPSFPPRQALDWLGIAIFLMVLPFFTLPLHTLFSCFYLLSISLLFILLSTWSVISYEATFLSHWLIWLELIALFITLILLVNRHLNIPVKQGINYVNFSFLIGVLGAVTILNGSLLLGLLVLAYAFLLSAPAIKTIFFSSALLEHDMNESLHIVVTFYLILLCRVYAEIPFIIMSILFSILIFGVRESKVRLKLQYLPSLFCLIILGISAWLEYGYQASEAAYY